MWCSSPQACFATAARLKEELLEELHVLAADSREARRSAATASATASTSACVVAERIAATSITSASSNDGRHDAVLSPPEDCDLSGKSKGSNVASVAVVLLLSAAAAAVASPMPSSLLQKSAGGR